MTALALLSDIHGNLPDLEAVAADIRERRPDMVYVLGDMVHGCPWSAEVLTLVASLGWPMLMGNHDDAVLQLGTPRMEARYAVRARYPTLWWAREHLTDIDLAMLAELPEACVPPVQTSPQLRLFHGLPGNFFAGFRPDSPETWITKRLAPVDEPTVVAGHTHYPMVRRVGRWQVINTGSVGMPYDGIAQASYAWLESTKDGWRASVCRVPYDIKTVVDGYRHSGLAAAGGVMGEMFLRSIQTGLPWISDFAWWLREQPAAVQGDIDRARIQYDAAYGPGNWAFPYV